MKRIHAYLDITFDKLKNKDWDNLALITGDEGVSKSTLGLHFVEYWYTKLNGECKAEDVKHMCLDRLQFLEDLKDCQKYECTIFDEAGDIGSRKSMSAFNIMLMEVYQIIRGDNLFSVFILPSIFDLDTFFRNRRVRGLFYVYGRGRVAFWSKSRLRKMLQINQHKMVKNLFAVRPTFFDTFPKYKGVMAEAYAKKKAEKMKNIREELYKKMKGEDKPKDVIKETRLNRLKEQREKGLTLKEIAKYEGVSIRQVQRILKQDGDTDKE